MIRVGKRRYMRNGKYVDPSYPNFTPIICLTKSTQYGSLGPYCLVDENGIIMENFWQFSKVYPKVPAVKQRYSRFDKTVIWEHPEELHAIYRAGSWTLTDKYFEWRQKGMFNKYAVRYPVGHNYRNQVLFSLTEDENNNIIYEPLTYIEARKKIYIPKYCQCVKSQLQFKELKSRLDQGENLLIIEVVGPVSESLAYYQEKYNVPSNWIENDTILATKENLTILCHDDKHPFGHGYCLSMALLNINID